MIKIFLLKIDLFVIINNSILTKPFFIYIHIQYICAYRGKWKIHNVQIVAVSTTINIFVQLKVWMRILSVNKVKLTPQRRLNGQNLTITGWNLQSAPVLIINLWNHQFIITSKILSFPLLSCYLLWSWFHWLVEVINDFDLLFDFTITYSSKRFEFFLFIQHY